LLVSASLNRVNLRDSESALISKYSRFSEREFCIFGTITQGKNSATPKLPESQNQSEALKCAIAQMTIQLSELENKFCGRLGNEIIVDPIAIYREI
ncbi:MAG: hypothetical protein AAF685_06120, partial [Cyanobacteria bacterium P01_C01_bin.89]